MRERLPAELLTGINQSVELATDATSHRPLNDANLNRPVIKVCLRFLQLNHVLKSNHVELLLQQRCTVHKKNRKVTTWFVFQHPHSEITLLQDDNVFDIIFYVSRH